MYARLTPAQIKILKSHVKGRTVCDLGGGDGELANLMMGWGAKGVALIDPKRPGPLNKGVTWHKLEFEAEAASQLMQASDTLVLSWPCNYPALDLLPSILPEKKLVYIGANHDGTACGTSTMWEGLVQNNVLEYSCDRCNNMIVYDIGKLRLRQQLLFEELNGVNLNGKMYSYREGMSDEICPMVTSGG